MTDKKKSWLKGLVDKYNDLCKDLGVDAGACRGCVPIVKFDPEKEQHEKAQAEKEQDKHASEKTEQSAQKTE